MDERPKTSICVKILTSLLEKLAPRWKKVDCQVNNLYHKWRTLTVESTGELINPAQYCSQWSCRLREKISNYSQLVTRSSASRKVGDLTLAL